LLTERSIINFLIWIGGLIVGPYLAISALSGNFAPALAVASICFLVFIFGFWRDQICFLPLLGLFIAGRLNFLPFRLATSDLCSMALVVYYIIAYIALQRKIMKTGPMFFFLPIVIVAAIILYHIRGAGLRSMGGGEEGARGALFVLLACVGYLCGVSVNTPSPSFFAKIPLFCLAATMFSAIPYTLSTYFPHISPFLVLVTDNINDTAYSSEVLGGGEGLVRNAGQAGVGAVLMGYLVSVYPMGTWWRPHRWWVAILALGCCELVIMGGFRSSFLNFCVMVFVATWCHYSWRTLILLPPALFGIFLATAVQDSHLVRLPMAAQRTLAFLPGDWDAAVIDSTDSSNDFRQKIQQIYIKEDLRKSPLLGNGFSYSSDEFQKMNYLAKTQDTPDGYYAMKVFVTGKMFHTGWISVYDSVGLVGSAAFVFMSVSLLWVIGPTRFGVITDHRSPLFPLKVWVFANNFSSFIGYFTVFGDFKAAFPALCYSAIIIHHLMRLEKHGYTGTMSLREFHYDPAKIEASVPA
jgi:hypothetical protein